ncbi:MAG: hypothetical protein A3B99_03920 [Candidatus Yanofskybacteria bacterium RIFCSPHIGHO2_02_FULL_44_12b]|uniref:HTH HARE-type domain-containing protein n=2 Tax=Candidatus Yanofskyibacteriota TaxID=1752733 RepID=A0A1F8GN12_9BACT|nr:MAG: RNA polymerase sigma factor [Candidatus Yanofskybacteria bacterium GW2011_GWA2_44_9]OGN04670.1 MAG: hypothetical protein A2659_00920 [Candidatus Yanofskybacteria bacterium RIFCSPHIGHO2_01_FULL_44_24]OGN15665.1 MAG: hypothetical protein A3B99_03920 [Candidatus Yanofskybacteria bacterium RIFCSPHIGHO2_02_FULL_44_12b]OGN26721.1 MAG: hypothetical protein A2925_04005 [Candidatus Yanofskybacteria bacterium RIFCSPLOWO2_01_FULL_44_22]
MPNNNAGAIAKTVVGLVKNLSTRNRDIISRRFGLKTGRKETLESIGKSYGITRERVRQIEEFSMNQLAKTANVNPDVARYVSAAEGILRDNGGAAKERDLFKAFSGNDKDSVANASLVFLLTLNNEPVRFHENDDFHSFWALNSKFVDYLRNTSASLANAMNKTKKIVPADQFKDFLRSNHVSGPDGDEVSDGHVQMLLSVSKSVSKNIFNEVGLSDWSDIRPKGVRDKAYLVLKKEKSPKHFTDIAKLINVATFSSKKANIQTVHNELIKDQRFVLVGRGMYGLSEWGYQPGTVKDVLVSVLKNSSQPLPRAQLVSRVMDARMVKENTVLLNLQDSKVFLKKEDGTYALRKA